MINTIQELRRTLRESWKCYYRSDADKRILIAIVLSLKNESAHGNEERGYTETRRELRRLFNGLDLSPLSTQFEDEGRVLEL